MRLRRSSSAGKNDPERSLGILTSISSEVFDTVFSDAHCGRCPLLGAFVAAGADLLGRLSLEQRLQPGADQLGEHRTDLSGLQVVELGEQGRMVRGHRVVFPLLESLGR